MVGEPTPVSGDSKKQPTSKNQLHIQEMQNIGSNVRIPKGMKVPSEVRDFVLSWEDIATNPRGESPLKNTPNYETKYGVKVTVLKKDGGNWQVSFALTKMHDDRLNTEIAWNIARSIANGHDVLLAAKPVLKNDKVLTLTVTPKEKPKTQLGNLLE